jgi:uncharacterized membrane protein YhaH (DUF805 family)
MIPFNVAIVRWVRGAFRFEGRATRAEYWWPRLLVAMVELVLLIVFIQGGGQDWLIAFVEWSQSRPEDFSDLNLPALSSLSTFAATFAVVFSLLTFFPNIAVAWRRFHDLGRPGWFHLIFLGLSTLTPFVMFGQLIWFIFPGQRQANRYGPDPLATQRDIF